MYLKVMLEGEAEVHTDIFFGSREQLQGHGAQFGICLINCHSASKGLKINILFVRIST